MSIPRRRTAPLERSYHSDEVYSRRIQKSYSDLPSTARLRRDSEARMSQSFHRGDFDENQNELASSPERDLRDDEDESEVAILVLGLTGSGKSTFISLAADEDVHVGHDLTSDTNCIKKYTAHVQDRKVILIDTPGFDDTTRSDTEVLGDIALYLSMLSKSPVKLIGVLYCHRVTDVRLSGSSMKSIVMLKKLCGVDSYQHVFVVTTMWDNLDNEAQGNVRAKQLFTNKEFFGDMVDNGARRWRFRKTKEDARTLIAKLLNDDGNVVLDIQWQLAHGQSLEETTVGAFIYQDLLDRRKKYVEELRELEQALKEARESRDTDMLSVISEDDRNQRRQLANLENDRRTLQASVSELAEREHPEFAALLKGSASSKKDMEELERLRTQVATLQNEKQELEHENRQMGHENRQMGRRSAQDNRIMRELEWELGKYKELLRRKEEEQASSRGLGGYVLEFVRGRN